MLTALYTGACVGTFFIGIYLPFKIVKMASEYLQPSKSPVRITWKNREEI